MELIHAVGEVMGAMTSCCSRSSKASFTFVLSAASGAINSYVVFTS